MDFCGNKEIHNSYYLTFFLAYSKARVGMFVNKYFVNMLIFQNQKYFKQMMIYTTGDKLKSGEQWLHLYLCGFQLHNSS